MVKKFFASSWRLADRIYAPRDLFLGTRDDEIQRLYLWRTVIWSLIIGCVALRYHHFSGISETADAVFQSIGWTTEFAMLAIVPSGIAVLALTVPAKRGEALNQMRYPATAFGVWVLVYLAARVLTGSSNGGLLVDIVKFVIMAWLAAFMIRMIYHMAFGLFRLGDAHPLLPPAVTALAAWSLALKGLMAGSANSGEPAAVAFLMLIGGPISVTVLAAMEIDRLRQRYPDQFPFREGPLRQPLRPGP